MKHHTAPKHYLFKSPSGETFDLNFISKQAFGKNGNLDLTPFQYAKLIEAFQYIARADRKNGLEDIEKAHHCLKTLLNTEEDGRLEAIKEDQDNINKKTASQFKTIGLE